MQTNAKPRKIPRQERARSTYDAILEAAARIFGERGYAGTTTNEVAEVAGVSIGSFYQYFPNKDALIGALQLHHKQQIIAACEAVVEQTHGRTLRESIAALVSAWFAIHLHDVRFHRRLEVEFAPFDAALDEEGVLTAAIVEHIRTIIAAYGDAVTAPDLELAALIVTRTLTGQAHAAIETPLAGVSAAALEAAVSTSIVGYLTAPL